MHATSSHESGSPIPLINLTLLDQLCVDYLLHQGLVQPSEKTAYVSEYLTMKNTLAKLNTIKQQIHDGHIEVAIDLISSVCPDLLKNSTLTYKLYKQQFIELLRDKNLPPVEALSYLQSRLSPTALSASPGAYNDFKAALLALVFRPRRSDESEGSTNEVEKIVDEWSISRRHDLATLIYATLLRRFKIREPKLALAIRYLCIIHNTWTALRGESSAVPEVDKLILPDRYEEDWEEEAEQEEKAEVENRSKGTEDRAEGDRCIIETGIQIVVNEEDANMLAQAVNLSRPRAIKALERAHGSVDTAFTTELSLTQVGHGLLAELVQEYCSYRGLFGRDALESEEDVDVDESTNILIEDAKGKSNLTYSLRRLRRFISQLAQIPLTTPIATVILDELNEMGLTRRYSDPAAPCNNNEMLLSPYLYFALRRCEFLEHFRNGSLDNAWTSLREGMAPLTQAYPDLIPQVKECAMLLTFHGCPAPPGLGESLLRSAAETCNINLDEAMRELMSCETVVEIVLLLNRWLDPRVLAESLRASLATAARSLLSSADSGVEEAEAHPRLVSILGTFLDIHTRWFQQQCQEDRFERVIALNRLKQVDPFLVDTLWERKHRQKEEKNIWEEANIGVEIPEEEVMRIEQDAQRRGINDDAIATVMDIMACSRFEALSLLLEYGGNTSQVLEIMFS
ncbi:uncharacterized protein VTP21DRAFT_5966 [Calcarisporiella thermophila]|uniref:uncharacterized protein n=1 Tax=Calcarisporiella thermophila TaxID=911321 RepID=UPI003742BFEA